MAANSPVYIIDGGLFDTKEQFFAMAERLFTNGSVAAGHNLDAFNDLLRGGFGKHAYGTPIHIIWKNVNRSRWQLGNGFVDTVIGIITDSEGSGHTCTLELD